MHGHTGVTLDDGICPLHSEMNPTRLKDCFSYKWHLDAALQFLSHVAMSCFLSWKPFFLLPNSNWLSKPKHKKYAPLASCSVSVSCVSGEVVGKMCYYIMNYTNNTNTCFASLLHKHLFVSCRDQRRLLVSVTVLNVSQRPQSSSVAELGERSWLVKVGRAPLSSGVVKDTAGVNFNLCQSVSATAVSDH